MTATSPDGRIRAYLARQYYDATSFADSLEVQWLSVTDTNTGATAYPIQFEKRHFVEAMTIEQSADETTLWLVKVARPGDFRDPLTGQRFNEDRTEIAVLKYDVTPSRLYDEHGELVFRLNFGEPILEARLSTKGRHVWVTLASGEVKVLSLDGKSRESLRPTEATRDGIWVASLKDEHTSRRIGAWSSQLRGTEAGLIRPFVSNEKTAISLGSGPDVFRPLYDFPGTKVLHMIDALVGWGSGPRQVISEIEARIQALNPHSRRIQDGFLASVSADALDDRHKFWELVNSTELEPAIWAVGDREVHLHPMNFNSTRSVARLLAGIPKSRLGGILMTGISVYNADTINLLLAHLSDNGYFVYERYVQKDGTQHDRENFDLVDRKFRERGLTIVEATPYFQGRGAVSVLPFVASRRGLR